VEEALATLHKLRVLSIPIRATKKKDKLDKGSVEKKGDAVDKAKDKHDEDDSKVVLHGLTSPHRCVQLTPFFFLRREPVSVSISTSDIEAIQPCQGKTYGL